MGDGGNIAIRQRESDPLIYLYTHWRGYAVKEALAAGLKRGMTRWSDPSYLTRIIFDDLKGDDTDTTGFGISLHEGDNNYPIPAVDMAKHLVIYDGEAYTYEAWVERYG